MIAITSKHVMGLDANHLHPINEHHCLLKDVAMQFTHMRQAALSDDVDIQICSSYRSFEKQLSIWNRKWSGELPLYTIESKIIQASSLTDAEKIHAIMLWSALPGASRHHWGSDFDVYDKREITRRQHKLELVSKEYEGNGPCAKLAKWVQLNAQDFGFYLPYSAYVGGVAREPWHLSHKVSAHAIEHNFDIDALYTQIEQADILGKSTVLENLPLLVEQYTFNLGNKVTNTSNSFDT